MNLKEFSALKAGDKIANTMQGVTSAGEVVATSDSGVRVVWGARHDKETPFFYSVNTTAWMHWTRTDNTQVTPDP